MAKVTQLLPLWQKTLVMFTSLTPFLSSGLPRCGRTSPPGFPVPFWARVQGCLFSRELTCSRASTPPGPPQVSCPATDAGHMTSPLLPGRRPSLPKEGEVTSGHGLQQQGHRGYLTLGAACPALGAEEILQEGQGRGKRDVDSRQQWERWPVPIDHAGGQPPAPRCQHPESDRQVAEPTLREQGGSGPAPPPTGLPSSEQAASPPASSVPRSVSHDGAELDRMLAIRHVPQSWADFNGILQRLNALPCLLSFAHRCLGTWCGRRHLVREMLRALRPLQTKESSRVAHDCKHACALIRTHRRGRSHFSRCSRGAQPAPRALHSRPHEDGSQEWSPRSHCLQVKGLEVLIGSYQIGSVL